MSSIGEITTVHVPPSDLRAWRKLITFQRHVVEKRTGPKNGVRGLLRTLGIKASMATKPWTRKSIQSLGLLLLEHSIHLLTRYSTLSAIEPLSNQLNCFEKELERYAEGSIVVQLSRSIPGVGVRTAEATPTFIDD